MTLMAAKSVAVRARKAQVTQLRMIAAEAEAAADDLENGMTAKAASGAAADSPRNSMGLPLLATQSLVFPGVGANADALA